MPSNALRVLRRMATSHDASAIDNLQTSLLPDHAQSLYQPIDSENGDIRVVELVPGRYDDPIQLLLRTENLNKSAQYEALSYAWGTDVSSRRALVDGYPVPVTESLDLGLRRLRYDNRPRTLWIDALCMNQTDTL
jgi:hypothetical protein